jgi:hypothetical protein
MSIKQTTINGIPASWLKPNKLKRPLQMKKKSEEEEDPALSPAALIPRVQKDQLESRPVTLQENPLSGKKRKVEDVNVGNNEKKARFEQRSEAVTLVTKDTFGVQGRAAQAFTVYRDRVRQLSQPKSDMTAYKELRQQWTPALNHGHIPGVPVGARLRGRGEAAIVGIHTQMMRGIDSRQGGSCFAVCMSGGYVDDEESGDSDGRLIYTGEGGQKEGRQVADQKEERGNAALMQSYASGEPIRLLRGGPIKGGGAEYYYDGLFKCTGYTYEASKDGPKVYKFTLEPIADESICESRRIAKKPKYRPIPDVRRRLEQHLA